MHRSLSNEDVTMRGHELAEAVYALGVAEEAAKQVSKDWRKRIEALRTRVHALTDAVRTRTEPAQQLELRPQSGDTDE